MKTIEKIAVRGGAKHVAALVRRAIKGEKTIPRFLIMGKKVEMPMRVPLGRKKEFAKAFRAAKREVGKAVKKRPGVAAAAVGAGGVGLGYGLGGRRKKKER